MHFFAISDALFSGARKDARDCSFGKTFGPQLSKVATTASPLNPTHGFPEYLSLGMNSLGQWATTPNGSLIVFVHGFGGDAIATWNDMQVMLPQDPRAVHADLVYYGYPSLRSRASVHADDFLDFLEALLRTRPAPYNRIVVVAHSLGGVVVRRAIIVAHREKRSWIATVRAVLFAPAHRGASIQKLVAQATGVGFLPSLYALTQYVVPVLQDLHPKDSELLRDMRSEYEKAITHSPGAPLAARVVVGRDDDVVEPHDFLPDDRRESWKGHGHFSVCKPNDGFRNPIDFIMEALL